METKKLQEKIKELEGKIETQDKEILLLRAVLKAVRKVSEDRSVKEDKERLKELEDQLSNL